MAKTAKTGPGDPGDRYPIQAVSRYTGLSVDLIRSWEKRHKAVKPARTGGGRRRYSGEDIKRLSLLRQVTEFGVRISEAAGLSTEELAEAVRHDASAAVQKEKSRPSTDSVMELFDRCSSAAAGFDAGDLQAALNDAVQELGALFFLEDLIPPLLHHVGEECREGELRNCHHRLFTEAVRGCLIALCRQCETAENNFVACSMAKDPGLTALRAAAFINALGWNPAYLGECAAGDEIADAAALSGAKAVIISFGASGEDPHIPNEMRRLAARLPDEVRLIVNAPEACAYSSVLDEAEAPHARNLGELRLEFERLTTNGTERETA